MTTPETISEIPEEESIRWWAKAEALGPTLEEWRASLAEAAPSNQLEALFESHAQGLTREDFEWMPQDDASEHDHYIYGFPKRNQ
jgi:hypothetical protein